MRSMHAMVIAPFVQVALEEPVVLAEQVCSRRSSVNSNATSDSNAEDAFLALGLPPFCEGVKRMGRMFS